MQLALALPGRAHKDSKYRRLQRLFHDVSIDFSMVALFIAKRIPYEKYRLTLDRTNWKYGNKHINIMFLGIVHEGTAIPILWVTLGEKKKRGNSNTSERIMLINKFIEIFGAESIDYLVADREFIGCEWLKYLVEKNIKFRIRIRHNLKISCTRGGTSPARNFFRNLAVSEAINLGKRKILGQMLFVSGARLINGEYLIIITGDPASCEEVFEDYKKRWEIETLFKALKTQGFDFESTHLTEPEKIDKLIAFLAIAFLWAHLEGEWLNEQKQIKVKTHKRKAISLFRYGLDYLREIFLNISEKNSELQIALTLIQPRSPHNEINLTY